MIAPSVPLSWSKSKHALAAQSYLSDDSILLVSIFLFAVEEAPQLVHPVELTRSTSVLVNTRRESRDSGNTSANDTATGDDDGNEWSINPGTTRRPVDQKLLTPINRESRVCTADAAVLPAKDAWQYIFSSKFASARRFSLKLASQRISTGWDIG